MASTTRSSLARPRASLSNPNLSASYKIRLQTAGTNGNSYRANALNRQASLSALNTLHRKSSFGTLTSGSLASIPDGSIGYGLDTVLDEDSLTVGRMASYSPHRGDEPAVGDLVDVPGGMHGMVKFVGSIPGKRGLFAGVELSEEFAARGKNNGDVDGLSYFATTITGAGIFLPIARAIRRGSPSSHEGSFPMTPTTPGFKMGGPGPSFTPPTPSLPKFSQSLGPGRAPSPQFKKSRPSLPRPESPLRRPQISGRPSIGTPVPKTPARYGSPAPGKFGQSVRGTQDSRDPSKKVGFASKSGLKSSVGPRSASALGSIPVNYSDEDTTPIGVARTTRTGKDNESLGSVSSFTAKMRPASRANNNDEMERLRSQLEEKNRQLKDQASSLAEMESSLIEVQALMNSSDGGMRHNRGNMEDKDTAQLRTMLREKNEKIAMLTAEFDAHRADFRSTIDTLELASTETERVYERRVDDLVQEVRELQERGEDVESVARQLKQLEELVQELEEGLEDARRGEAEARGEVEFLRGEVERTRSELRREREKASASMNGSGTHADAAQASKDLVQRDDEIRGLKAIIHSLSRDAVPDNDTPNPDPQKTPTQQQGSFPSNRRPSQGTDGDRLSSLPKDKLEKEVVELRLLVESKRHREEELEREVERLRRSSAAISAPNNRASVMTTGSTGTITTKDQSPVQPPKATTVSWRDQRPAETHRRAHTLETMPESDTYSSTADSVVFCEICESPGHDILSCTNMFGSKPLTNGTGNHARNNSVPQQRTGKDIVMKGLSPENSLDDFKPAPLSPTKEKNLPLPPAPVKIIPNPMEQGPVAGKDSGVIDPTKWCGVCERDGHESIDCPFEDAF